MFCWWPQPLKTALFLFFLLRLLTQAWPVLEPIRLAAAPHFQLFLQVSKLISVIKSGHLWQQLGAGKQIQGSEACQISVEWSAASPCGTYPGLEDSSPCFLGLPRPVLALTCSLLCDEGPCTQGGSHSPLMCPVSRGAMLLECRGNGFIDA